MPAPDFRVGRACLPECAVLGERDHAAQHGVVSLEPRDVHLRQLERGDLAASNKLGQLGHREKGDIVDIRKNATQLFAVNDTGIKVGGAAGTTVKAIEIGTCTNANAAATVCSAANGNTTGLTLGNITTSDVILISMVAAPGTSARPCDVDTLVNFTSFRINCTANPGNGNVWNVIIIRH